MKITYKQTAEFLNNPSSVLASLIYGPDEGSVLSHSRKVITAILGEAYDPINVIELGDAQLKEDPAKLADECGAMSLMGGKRLVWLRNISDKYAGLIEPCIPLLGPDCYLLVSAGELPPRSKLRQLFEQHKQLASLACYRAEGRNLANMIRETMAKHQMQLSSEALQLLTQELGNDAMITESELEKLSLYAHGASSVGIEDVKAAIVHNDEHQIDPLCRYFVDGNYQQFDQLWQHLIRDGQPPIILLRSLARYISRLLALKLTMQIEGVSAEQAVSQAKPPIFWSQKDGMTRGLTKLSSRHLVYYLHLLNQAECNAKLLSQIGDIAPHRVLLQPLAKQAA